MTLSLVLKIYKKRDLKYPKASSTEPLSSWNVEIVPLGQIHFKVIKQLP